MDHYRLYFRNGPDGRMVDVRDIMADNDEDACEQANAFVGERAMELWCGKRRVHCYDPDQRWLGIAAE